MWWRLLWQCGADSVPGFTCLHAVAVAPCYPPHPLGNCMLCRAGAASLEPQHYTELYSTMQYNLTLNAKHPPMSVPADKREISKVWCGVWESRTRLIASWPAPPNCGIVPLSAPDYCYPYRYYLIPAKFGFSAWRAAPHCSCQRRPAQQFHKREKSMSSSARQSPSFPGSGGSVFTSLAAAVWTDRRIPLAAS